MRERDPPHWLNFVWRFSQKKKYLRKFFFYLGEEKKRICGKLSGNGRIPAV